MSGPTPTPLHIRVLRRCIIGDCWEFTGALKDGYGVVTGSRSELRGYAHRVVWEALVGPIEDTLDHLCRNRKCCNPDHLQPKSRGANVLAGYGISAMKARQTHCKRGHVFDAENTYHSPTGRKCRTCHRDRQRTDHREKVSA